VSTAAGLRNSSGTSARSVTRLASKMASCSAGADRICPWEAAIPFVRSIPPRWHAVITRLWPRCDETRSPPCLGTWPVSSPTPLSPPSLVAEPPGSRTVTAEITHPLVGEAVYTAVAPAGQSVSASLATAGQDLFDGRPGGRGSPASKRLQLLAGGRRQRDLDGRLRLPGISSSRSSARTAVSRPAATSSSAWSSKGSSSTARSLSRRMTAISRGRSSW
jgi:hypothetical protein